MEGEASPVAFYEIAVVAVRDAEFHPVAAFDLERCVIPCGRVACVHIRIMVMRHLHPLGDDRSLHGQARGVVVFVPLADITHERHDDHAQNQHKHHREQHGKHRIKKTEAEHKASSLSGGFQEHACPKEMG